MRFPAFPDFANLWVALCPSEVVVRDKPTALTLAGERIVLFRDPDGLVRTLIDQCPHRGVALSLGSVERGVIACPFHGWQFDGAGRCLHVPWNPDAKRDHLSAVALPARDAGGIIWVHTGSEPRDEPAIPPALLRPDVRVTGRVPWRGVAR